MIENDCIHNAIRGVYNAISEVLEAAEISHGTSWGNAVDRCLNVIGMETQRLMALESERSRHDADVAGRLAALEAQLLENTEYDCYSNLSPEAALYEFERNRREDRKQAERKIKEGGNNVTV